MLHFDDLITAEDRPSGAPSADRGTIATDTRSMVLSDDVRNNGFISNVFNRRRASAAKASRRNFLRGSVAAAGASVAVASARFGPAKQVEAQGIVTGSFPYRIYTACPSWAASHDCNPGCGSTPVCTDCCDANGFFVEDQANGFRIHPGQCATAGGNVDGWLWAFAAPCGGCQSIEYRCHDGFKLLPSGGSFVWFPHICRSVTACGQTPVAPVASPTPTTVPFNPVPPTSTPLPAQPPASSGVSYVSSLASAVDNGNGTATLTGWLKANTSASIGYTITVDGVTMHTGTANQPYFTSYPGAGPNHGFTAVVGGLSAGTHEFCLNGNVNGVQTRLICTSLFISVGAGQVPAPTAVPTPPPPVPPVATSTPVPSSPGPSPVNPGVVPPFYGALGSLEVLRTGNDGNAFFSGWAARSNTAGSGPIDVVVTVDGVDVSRVRANLPRPGVSGNFQQAQGFSGSAQLQANRTSNVCVLLEDSATGARFQIGCRSVTGGSNSTQLPPLSGGGSNPPAATPTPTTAPAPTTGPAPTTAPAPTSVPAPTAVPGGGTAPPSTQAGLVHGIPANVTTVVGDVESISSPWAGIVIVEGWMQYPQEDLRPVAYEIFVNGSSRGVFFASHPHANASSSMGIGPNHGFSRVITGQPGTTLQIEVYPWLGSGRGTLIASTNIAV